MILRDIAHVRTGDKGDISQIAVFAYRPADFPLILAQVTAERVLDHLGGLPHKPFAVSRYMACTRSTS